MARKKDKTLKEEEIQKIIEKAKEGLEVGGSIADAVKKTTVTTRDIPLKIEPTTVKVVTTENRKCMIGNKSYEFVKGVVQEVPKNVRDILKRGGILKVAY